MSMMKKITVAKNSLRLVNFPTRLAVPKRLNESAKIYWSGEWDVALDLE